MRVVRFRAGREPPRFGLVPEGSTDVLELPGETFLDALGSVKSPGRAVTQARDAETLELPKPYELLAPLVPPESWAAGVTYERSRDARLEESGSDVYTRVYRAERPELFLKDAAGRRTVGPGGTIRVRPGSTWTVPEPELALVLGEDARVVGVTIGNDVTARDLEAENTLYLQQAKIFRGACALGPAVLLGEPRGAFAIECRIRNAYGEPVYEGTTSTERMVRSFAHLVEFLVRDNPVPPGSVLLTGTGLVPPDDVSLAPGHRVEVRIERIGRLVNTVGSAAVDAP